MKRSLLAILLLALPIGATANIIAVAEAEKCGIAAARISPLAWMRVGIPAHRLPKGALRQDIDDILEYGVMMTPALVVDGAVKASGSVPRAAKHPWPGTGSPTLPGRKRPSHASTASRCPCPGAVSAP